MAKRTIGFEDYEGDQYDEYTGDEPRIGAWYTGEVVRGKYDEEKDQMIWFIKLVDNPDYEGWVKGFYAPFDGGGKFKGQDFAKAIQGGIQKPLTFDPEKETDVARVVKAAKRIKFRTEEYNDRVKIGKVRALLQAVGASTQATKAAAPAPAPEPEVEEEALEDYTPEELGEMKVAELEEIITEEFSEELPEKATGRGAAVKYKAALVEAILEMQEEDADEEDGEDTADGEDPEFEDGFEDAAEEPEPEPEPAPRTRRARPAAKAAPAPAPAAAPAARTRRARR